VTLTVSVALCTYNGARFIGEQLSSILAQSRMPDEIVVSDDGSRDDTLTIVERMSATSPVPVRVLSGLEPLGVTRNFERAIRATAGEIIVLSDQDDIWKADRVERCVRLFEQQDDVDFVFGDAQMVDANGADLGYTLFEALEFRPDERRDVQCPSAFDTLLRRNVATGATAAFRRRLADAAMPFPADWVHDEWLAIIASLTGRLAVIDEPLIDYRQHGANQIGMRKPGFAQKVSRVLEPRGDRNRALVRRTEALVERMLEADFPAEHEHLEAAEGKLRIERVRAGLPKNRLLRLPTVLREAKTGDYERYTSQGRAEVLRDLLQPA